MSADKVLGPQRIRFEFSLLKSNFCYITKPLRCQFFCVWNGDADTHLRPTYQQETFNRYPSFFHPLPCFIWFTIDSTVSSQFTTSCVISLHHPLSLCHVLFSQLHRYRDRDRDTGREKYRYSSVTIYTELIHLVMTMDTNKIQSKCSYICYIGHQRT